MGSPSPVGLRDYALGDVPTRIYCASLSEVEKPPLAGSSPPNADPASGSLSPVEELLASIWSQVLGRQNLRVGDDFFDLGGQSLPAAQMIARARDLFGVDLDIRSVFENPTLAGLANVIEQARAGGHASVDVPLAPISRRGQLPMSFFQEWRFRADAALSVPLYNIALGFELRGPLKVESLQDALSHLVNRHEPLRTNYEIVDGRPVQIIHEKGTSDLQIDDLRAGPETTRREQAIHLLEAEASRVVDRRSEPLFHAQLVRFDEDAHFLLLRTDRIAVDGTSGSILIDELSALYAAYARGDRPELDPPPLQQADWAQWQRARLQGPRLDGLIKYWRGKLDSSRPLLEMAIPDLPAPKQPNYRGCGSRLELGAALTSRLRRLARENGATLFMVVLAALDSILAKLSRSEQATVLCPIANRTRPELERLVGCFAHGVVYRTDLSGDPSFRDLVKRVREVCLDAWAHHELPISEVARYLRPSSYLTVYDEFHVFFDGIRRQPMLRLPGIAVDRAAVDKGAAHPSLALFLDDETPELSMLMRADADRFDEQSLGTLLRYLRDTLTVAASDPRQRASRLPPPEAALRDLLAATRQRARV